MRTVDSQSVRSNIAKVEFIIKLYTDKKMGDGKKPKFSRLYKRFYCIYYIT